MSHPFHSVRIIEDRLVRLPERHRIAFAASCCERLLPNYAAFSRMTGWGDVQALRTALDRAWAALSGDALDEAERRDLIAACDRHSPDTENFTSELTSAALDAAAAVNETLQCLSDPTASRAATVGQFAVDTVHMFLQVQCGLDPQQPDFEVRIFAHPLMVAEIENQLSALDTLSGIERLTAELLQELRTTYSRRGGNICMA
jgi:hypothetical protein